MATKPEVGTDMIEKGTEARASLLEVKDKEEKIPIRRVLIPIEVGEDSERAFHWYANELCRPGDYLVFTHIIPPVYAQGTVVRLHSFPTGFGNDEEDSCEETHSSLVRGHRICSEYKARARRLLPNEGGLRCKAYIQAALDPEEGLLEAVRIHGIHLVVIGNRGVGSVRRLLLGSVSDTLLHNAHIPVAVVPPPVLGAKKEARRLERRHSSYAPTSARMLPDNTSDQSRIV